MKGLLYKDKASGQWMIREALVTPMVGIVGFRTLRLHPEDVKEMEEQEKLFDNLEARVAAYPEVEYEVRTIATGNSEWDVLDEDV
ncbi:MAG: hypothetical protein EBU08_18225, partial [Micrococcales bacterium]|nr:hypothetical protein [Micrococcales bacterium]